MIKLLLSSFLILVTLVSPAIAQFPGVGGTTQPKALPGTAGDQSPKGNAKLSGSIVDSSSAKGIEFASIALYNKATGANMYQFKTEFKDSKNNDFRLKLLPTAKSSDGKPLGAN